MTSFNLITENIIAYVFYNPNLLARKMYFKFNLSAIYMFYVNQHLSIKC
jgi:hypothetical protein